jgi:hypothetical protein
MPKFAHADVLDGGIAYIKANATRMLLIKNYAFGDSYATVAANTIASVTMTSADYTLSSSGNSRVCTSAAKTGGSAPTASASSVAGDNLHVAFTDGSAKVLIVLDETTDQVITSGNPVDMPAGTYTSNQPT